ncbi:MAG: cytidylate kinase-like family protein [Clostridia bacterium]|nr:cytidylate kinase-like family protein [Clostridia bacterium]
MSENKQLIITIGRQFGSMGHKIAHQLGKELDLPVVDKDLLFLMAENHGFDGDFLKNYDEKPVNHWTSGEARGMSNSIEKVLADMIFKYQSDLVATGGSFIFVGRCAEWNLRGCDNHIRIFITADDDARIAHIAELRKLSKKDAEALMHKMDKRRKNYNHSHGNKHWGETENYDLIVNTSDLGLEGSVEVIKNYVNVWKKKNSIDTDD